jgi:hypothetical protein
MDCDRHRGGSSAVLICGRERIRCSCGRRHNHAGAAHRSELRVNDVVSAVRGTPAQCDGRSGSDGRRIRGETGDCRIRPRGYVGTGINGAHLDHIKARGGDLLQQIQIGVIQRLSGVPLIKIALPLSARIIPYFLSAVRITRSSDG